MIYLRITVIFIFIFSMTGCALYDPERGAFVSSSVQSVNVSLPSSITKIHIAKFKYPNKSSVINESTTFAISGAFIPVSNTYKFDKVDREYLHKSLISSLKLNKNITVNGLPLNADKQTMGDINVHVNFKKLGMVSTTWNYFCMMDAEVTVVTPKSNKTTLLEIKGGVTMGSVAAAKDDAIKKFVENVAKLIAQAS